MLTKAEGKTIEHAFVRKLCIAFTVLSFFQNSLSASPLRISFLNDAKALQDTLSILKTNGCSNKAIGSFQKAIEHYNSSSLPFDLSKLPTAQNGFYSFQSSSQLLAVIPHKLWDMPRPFEFNCFDTAILLADGQLRTEQHPDDRPKDFLAEAWTVDGQIMRARVATAREAFHVSYPAYYLDATKNYFPSSMANNRICMAAAFYCWHILPQSTTDQNVKEDVLRVLQTSWKRQAITFPKKFDVILCHNVNPGTRYFPTVHAGLLFHSGTGYVYIEKTGGSGPFVRLDIEDKSDLLAWLSWKADKREVGYDFVTFNDSTIELLPTRF